MCVCARARLFHPSRLNKSKFRDVATKVNFSHIRSSFSVCVALVTSKTFADNILFYDIKTSYLTFCFVIFVFPKRSADEFSEASPVISQRLVYYAQPRITVTKRARGARDTQPISVTSRRADLAVLSCHWADTRATDPPDEKSQRTEKKNSNNNNNGKKERGKKQKKKNK